MLNLADLTMVVEDSSIGVQFKSLNIRLEVTGCCSTGVACLRMHE